MADEASSEMADEASSGMASVEPVFEIAEAGSCIFVSMDDAAGHDLMTRLAMAHCAVRQ